MKNILALTVLSVAATFATVAPAMSQVVPLTTTGTITVGAGTAAFCTTPTTAPVALGNYDGLAPASNTQSIKFKCTNTTAATVTLSSASTSTATGGDLKTTPANASPIAYTFAPTGLLTGTGTGLVGAAVDIDIPVKVDIAAGQNPIPGTYKDIINVTVTY